MPFWREAVTFGIIGTTFPGAMAAFYLGHGQWLRAGVIGVTWLAIYIPLAIWYDYLGRIRLAVTLGIAIAVIAVVWFASAVGSI